MKKEVVTTHALAVKNMIEDVELRSGQVSQESFCGLSIHIFAVSRQRNDSAQNDQESSKFNEHLAFFGFEQALPGEESWTVHFFLLCKIFGERIVFFY